mmetsp:Transcript_16752/g.32645  ORF Transcript_16752/g.32645 Transcript_16752/m.32645 type:complete len:86 (+) Transcript_16752:98-355(+)
MSRNLSHAHHKKFYVLSACKKCLALICLRVSSSRAIAAATAIAEGRECDFLDPCPLLPACLRALQCVGLRNTSTISIQHTTSARM